MYKYSTKPSLSRVLLSHWCHCDIQILVAAAPLSERIIWSFSVKVEMNNVRLCKIKAMTDAI